MTRRQALLVTLLLGSALAGLFWLREGRHQENIAQSVAPPSITEGSPSDIPLSPEVTESWSSLAAEAQQKAAQNEIRRAAELFEESAELRSETQWDEAIALYDRAIELRRAGGDLEKEGFARNDRGVLLRWSGKWDLAEVDYRLALDIAVGSGFLILEAESLNNLGSLLEKRGQYGQARELYERAFAILERIPGKEAARITTLGRLEQLNLIEGDFAEAALLLQRMQEIHNNAPTSKALGYIHSEIGWLDLIQEQPTKALGSFLQALENIEGMDPQDQIVLWTRLGEALAEVQRSQESLLAYEEALRLARRNGKEPLGLLICLCQLETDHPELAASGNCDLARKAAASSSDPNLLASHEMAQARFFVSRGNWTDALKSSATAVEHVESMRLNIGGRNRKTRFFDDRSRFFKARIALLMDAHGSEPAKRFDLQALEVSEKLRARSLRELWAEAGVFSREDPELSAARERKMQELLWLENERGLPERKTRIKILLTELDILNQKLDHGHPKQLADGAAEKLDLAEVQNRLDEQTAILDLVLNDGKSQLWVIEKHRVRALDLPRGPLLAAAAENYLRLLADPEAGAHKSALWRAGYQLAKLLWGDNEERLEGLPPRMVFLGDGALLPFPVAALPRLDSSPEEPRYLIEAFEVVHLPALSLLDRKIVASQRPAPTETAILLGDPVYLLDNAADIQLEKLTSAEISAYLPPTRPQLPLGRLPFADQEAALIQARFNSFPLRIALGPKASRALALSPEMERYSILHLVSHGWKDEENVELSAMLLSEVDENGQPVDGKLRLQDLYRLKLRADLVVASACQTGMGGSYRLDGVGGLAQGFLHAGARRALVSLWQVESESTARLMDHFYRHLLAGQPPGAALRSASLDLIRDAKEFRKPWASPFYWAPFILVGDWTRFEIPFAQADTEHSGANSVQ